MGKEKIISEISTTLTIKVVPRAKKSEISQVMEDGTIKIRLRAPPVEGKANQALVKLLADKLGIRQQDIEIISGNKGRKKVVLLKGIDETTARSIIEKGLL